MQWQRYLGMHEALHPLTRQRVSTVKYLADFGRLPLGHKGPDTRPPAYCPFCLQPLAIVGGKSPGTDAHFAHKRNSGFCASKEPAGKPYLELAPRKANPQAGLAQMGRFKATWQLHLAKLESLVPALDFREFLELLSTADRWRIWEYSNLSLGHVPYVLIALADFSPATSRRNPAGTAMRALWLRFLYDSSMRHVEDLWIRPSTPPALFRVSYKVPARGAIPTQTHLLKSTPILIDTTFLTPTSPPATAAWLVAVVEGWFTKNWPSVV